MSSTDNPDVVGRDLGGFPYNKKYPPLGRYESTLYHGYPDSFRETLFYDFAVLGYDLEFTYQGKTYYVMNDGDNGIWLSDSKFTAKGEYFKNGNEFLEKFLLDGKPIIDIIDNLDDVQPI